MHAVVERSGGDLVLFGTNPELHLFVRKIPPKITMRVKTVKTNFHITLQNHH